MATIEITKAEAKEAGVFKSEMYENLKEAREATGYKVVVKDTKRKADTMKGLTYAYMTIYIEKKKKERGKWQQRAKCSLKLLCYLGQTTLFDFNKNIL